MERRLQPIFLDVGFRRLNGAALNTGGEIPKRDVFPTIPIIIVPFPGSHIAGSLSLIPEVPMLNTCRYFCNK